MYRRDLNTFTDALNEWESTELTEIEAGPRDKKKITIGRKKTIKRKPKKQLESDSDEPDDYVTKSKAKPAPKKPAVSAKPKVASKPEPPKSKEAKSDDTKKQKTITEMFKVPDIKPTSKRIVVSDSDDDSDSKVAIQSTAKKSAAKIYDSDSESVKPPTKKPAAKMDDSDSESVKPPAKKPAAKGSKKSNESDSESDEVLTLTERIKVYTAIKPSAKKPAAKIDDSDSESVKPPAKKSAAKIDDSDSESVKPPTKKPAPPVLKQSKPASKPATAKSKPKPKETKKKIGKNKEDTQDDEPMMLPEDSDEEDTRAPMEIEARPKRAATKSSAKQSKDDDNSEESEESEESEDDESDFVGDD